MTDRLQSSAQFSALVWFRDDLRLADHPALAAGAKAGVLTCVYLLDEDSTGLRPHGGASRWWLAQSLRTLDDALRQLGQRLILRRGKAADVMPMLAREAGATQVYWNRRYDRPGIAADDAVIAALKAQGVSGGTFPGNLLVEPGKVLTKDGGPMRVFTPFWKRVLALGDPRKPLPAPKQLPPPVDLPSDTLDDWQLEPTRPDWAGGLRDTWTPGEAAARERLDRFPRRHSRLCRRARPAGHALDVAAVAVSAFRRDQRARSCMPHDSPQTETIRRAHRHATSTNS